MVPTPALSLSPEATPASYRVQPPLGRRVPEPVLCVENSLRVSIMTSTSVTKIGRVMIVTQVIPQDDAAIPLETAVAATELPPPERKTMPALTKNPPTTPTKMDGMIATFLRGQPHGLGVVQIVIGVLSILFSMTAAFSPILMVHAPLCLAISFVISGALALAAVRWTTVSLVFNTLAWNIISAVFAVVGVAYLCWLLADRPASQRLCDSEPWGDIIPTDTEKISCEKRMWILNVSVYGPLGLLLVLMVLQVCAAITVSVFSGLAIRRLRSHASFKAADDTAPLCAAASVYDSNGE